MLVSSSSAHIAMLLLQPWCSLGINLHCTALHRFICQTVWSSPPSISRCMETPTQAGRLKHLKNKLGRRHSLIKTKEQLSLSGLQTSSMHVYQNSKAHSPPLFLSLGFFLLSLSSAFFHPPDSLPLSPSPHLFSFSPSLSPSHSLCSLTSRQLP